MWVLIFVFYCIKHVNIYNHTSWSYIPFSFSASSKGVLNVLLISLIHKVQTATAGWGTLIKARSQIKDKLCIWARFLSGFCVLMHIFVFKLHYAIFFGLFDLRNISLCSLHKLKLLSKEFKLKFSSKSWTRLTPKRCMAQTDCDRKPWQKSIYSCLIRHFFACDLFFPLLMLAICLSLSGSFFYTWQHG